MRTTFLFVYSLTKKFNCIDVFIIEYSNKIFVLKEMSLTLFLKWIMCAIKVFYVHKNKTKNNNLLT